MGIYMKYGNVVGDATQQGFTGWINLTGFDFSAHRKLTKTTGGAFNREPGQPDMGRITVTKDLDHSSGTLIKTAATAVDGQQCQIAFVRTGDPGETYLEFTLTDTLFESMTIDQGQEERPSETLILDFTQIEIEVKVLNEANQAATPLRVTYNIATGKGG